MSQTQSLYKKAEGLELLARRAAERIRELQAENKRLSGEYDLLANEQKKAQSAVTRYRQLADHHDRLKKKLIKLRDRMRKLEA